MTAGSPTADPAEVSSRGRDHGSPCGGLEGFVKGPQSRVTLRRFKTRSDQGTTAAAAAALQSRVSGGAEDEEALPP